MSRSGRKLVEASRTTGGDSTRVQALHSAGSPSRMEIRLRAMRVNGLRTLRARAWAPFATVLAAGAGVALALAGSSADQAVLGLALLLLACTLPTGVLLRLLVVASFETRYGLTVAGFTVRPELIIGGALLVSAFAWHRETMAKATRQLGWLLLAYVGLGLVVTFLKAPSPSKSFTVLIWLTVDALIVFALSVHATLWANHPALGHRHCCGCVGARCRCIHICQLGRPPIWCPTRSIIRRLRCVCDHVRGEHTCGYSHGVVSNSGCCPGSCTPLVSTVPLSVRTACSFCDAYPQRSTCSHSGVRDSYRRGSAHTSGWAPYCRFDISSPCFAGHIEAGGLH